MSEAEQLPLDKQPSPYKWSELGPYDCNIRYVGPDGSMALLVFESDDGFMVLLFDRNRHIGDRGPFTTLEIAKAEGETQADRLDLLCIPEKHQGPVCCKCGHPVCRQC